MGTDDALRTRDNLGTFDDIAEAAVRTTGLDDFGGTNHEEGLRLLVEDLRGPAGLTPRGNVMQRAQVKSALVGRLLSVAGFTRHPEHAQVPITRPLFVVGLPRTGTTALHRLLTADPAHQGLELWLTEYPQPRPPREQWADDPVFAGIQAAYAEQQVTHPEFLGLHYMDAATVEECWRLLRQQGKSIGFESLAYLPNYSAWLAEQDWTDAYQHHRRVLQLIGLPDAEKRWVLKNPSHLAALDALMRVYPDALVVCTHRDPVTSVASACSLSAEATAGWSEVFRGELVGRTQLDLLSREWHAFTEARPRYDQAQFVDVDYEEFVADPVGTTRGIYEAFADFGMAWTPEVAEAVARIDAESRQGPRAPSHTYDLADYGLTERDVRAAF